MTPKDLEQRPIADLTPYARNSRTHSEAQVAQIAASITEFGFTNPVLVDAEGGIIAGHGRVLAAQSLGLETVPVLVLDHLSEAQRRAYVIADNKLALNAGWDDDALRAEIEELARGGYGLDLIGFDTDELEALLNPPSTSHADPDEVPEPPAIPVTRPGDVWMMDKHRIICGDSTDAETVAALLAGAKPHLMVTDPPYGVAYDPKWRNRVRRKDGSLVGARATGEVLNDTQDDWGGAWALFPGNVAYVWHGSLHTVVVAESLVDCGFDLRANIIWAKNQMLIGRGDYHWKHEPCWYAVRSGKTGQWQGDRTQTTVWNIDKPRKSETGHSTQKPIECMKRPIENNSKPGDAVYEPFSGSGTTIIAAEMTGRRCFAIELSPAYVDVAVKRWEDFAGRVATLEATGQSFREVADERRALAA
jgi:DNA modification methylase